MKLSELDYDKAALAFPLVLKMRYNDKTVEFFRAAYSDKRGEGGKDDGGGIEVRPWDFFAEMVKNEPVAAKELFALLNDIDINKYSPNAGQLLNDMITAFIFDNELMQAFGLRAQATTKTEASTGSATENIGA